jgi:5-methylcytosine-specific restriction endonuclease McrA
MSDMYHRARYLAWREKVLRRAGYLCEECARYGRNTPATVAHHVKHADEYPELRYDLNNGRALCAACHNAAHPEKGGSRW